MYLIVFIPYAFERGIDADKLSLPLSLHEIFYPAKISPILYRNLNNLSTLFVSNMSLGKKGREQRDLKTAFTQIV